MKNIKIYAVGDIFLANQPTQIDKGVTRIIKTKGTEYLFKNVNNVFKNADVLMGNFETPVCEKKNIKSKIFRSEEYTIKCLAETGFDILSVANNHILEQGVDGYINTISIMKKNKILPIGEKNKTKIISIKGTKIGLIAFSSIDNMNINGPYQKLEINKIIEEIKYLKTNVDIIIISAHWGYEYINYPSPKQIEIAHKFIDSGANIILGHHPHVLQNIEVYKNNIIAYSLGNFIFDIDWWPDSFNTIILKIEITPNNRIKYAAIPIKINKNYQPTLIKVNDVHYKNIMKIIRSKPTLNDYATYIKEAKLKEKQKKKLQRIFFIKNIMKMNIYDYYFILLSKIKKVLLL
jgi:poly-gamma-glutamate synthesis protein (capsule biosynthesis protein)